MIFIVQLKTIQKNKQEYICLFFYQKLIKKQNQRKMQSIGSQKFKISSVLTRKLYAFILCSIVINTSYIAATKRFWMVQMASNALGIFCFMYVTAVVIIEFIPYSLKYGRNNFTHNSSILSYKVITIYLLYLWFKLYIYTFFFYHDYILWTVTGKVKVLIIFV